LLALSLRIGGCSAVVWWGRRDCSRMLKPGVSILLINGSGVAILVLRFGGALA
jgi:hypothetical protein